MSAPTDRFTRPPNPQPAPAGSSGFGSAKLWVSLVALAGVALLTTSWIRLRNELVTLDVAVDTQWKQVENQLERQHDLLPKLAAVARRYAEHEAGVFEKLAQARAAYAGASAHEKPRLAGEVDGVLANVLALAESYPELKADAQYRDLSYEIAGTQNRIALERQRYNELVGMLNARLRQIPWSLVANGFESATFYEAPREQLADPELVL